MGWKCCRLAVTDHFKPQWHPGGRRRRDPTERGNNTQTHQRSSIDFCRPDRQPHFQQAADHLGRQHLFSDHQLGPPFGLLGICKCAGVSIPPDIRCSMHLTGDQPGLDRDYGDDRNFHALSFFPPPAFSLLHDLSCDGRLNSSAARNGLRSYLDRWVGMTTRYLSGIGHR